MYETYECYTSNTNIQEKYCFIFTIWNGEYFYKLQKHDWLFLKTIIYKQININNNLPRVGWLLPTVSVPDIR